MLFLRGFKGRLGVHTLWKLIPGLLVLSLTLTVFGDRASAFCTGSRAGSRCHPDFIRSGLAFLRPQLLNSVAKHVDDPDDHGFLGLDYASDDHFDNCNLDGATERINNRYLDTQTRLGVVPALSPFRQFFGSPPRSKNRPDVFAASGQWARLLHATHDFYSHSNWVEMGFTSTKVSLIDGGLGPWTELPSDWGFVRQNTTGEDIVAAQEDPPDGWGGIFFPSSRRLPMVASPTGAFRVLITATGNASHLGNRCPAGLRIAHGPGDYATPVNPEAAMHKDNITAPLHREAGAMALAQTRHEWCRLLHLARSEEGDATAAVAMGLMVRPDAMPHPIETPCALASPGRFEVTIRAPRIRVFDDQEDDGSGQIVLVLAAFSNDFRRSARAQTQGIVINSGGTVASQQLLPAPIRLCMTSSDRLVVTLQGWEDDGSGHRGELSDEDDILNGATQVVGRVANLSGGLIPESFTRRSDNADNQDLEVTFDISVVSPSPACQPEIFG
jgi:hypothetical protein